MTYVNCSPQVFLVEDGPPRDFTSDLDAFEALLLHESAGITAATPCGFLKIIEKVSRDCAYFRLPFCWKRLPPRFQPFGGKGWKPWRPWRYRVTTTLKGLVLFLEGDDFGGTLVLEPYTPTATRICTDVREMDYSRVRNDDGYPLLREETWRVRDGEEWVEELVLVFHQGNESRFRLLPDELTYGSWASFEVRAGRPVLLIYNQWCAITREIVENRTL